MKTTSKGPDVPWWCFDKRVPKTYYPFPNCEEFLPKKYGHKRFHLLDRIKQLHFVGDHCESLSSKDVTRIIYFEKVESVSKCVFQFRHHPTKQEVFVYTVYAPESLWFDNSPFCEVYLARNLKDIQTAFPFTQTNE